MRQKDLLGCVTAAEVILDKLLDVKSSPIATELREKEKLGGYLTIADRSGAPLLIALIGTPLWIDRDAFLAYSQEKARRLAATKSHVRSYESRDPKKKWYGGALRDDDFIVSFSGLPEGVDEIVSLLVLLLHSSFALPVYLEHMKDNPYVEKLGLEFLQDTTMAVIRAVAE